MKRSQIIFLISITVFYVSHVVAVVVAANTGHLDTMVSYVIVLGCIAVVFGLWFIFYMLRRPPFSTGEWKQVLR